MYYVIRPLIIVRETLAINKQSKMKKAVIYTRISTDKQDAARQLNALNEYAVNFGYNVVKEFTDVVTGSKKAADRKAAAAMFDFLEREKIDIVLTSEISRLGRSAIDVQKNIDKIVFQMGIDLYIKQQGLKAKDEKGKINPVFKLISDVLANVAEMELEQIKERTKSKLDLKRKEYTAHNVAKGLKKGDKYFKQLGRPTGSTKAADALILEYKKVVKELNTGTSIRKTAKICDVSPATVQKVKAALKAAKEAGKEKAQTNKELKGQTALSI